MWLLLRFFWSGAWTGRSSYDRSVKKLSKLLLDYYSWVNCTANPLLSTVVELGRERSVFAATLILHSLPDGSFFLLANCHVLVYVTSVLNIHSNCTGSSSFISEFFLHEVPSTYLYFSWSDTCSSEVAVSVKISAEL